MVDSLSSIDNPAIGGIELSLDFSQQDSREKERKQGGSASVASFARENTDATGLKLDPEKQEAIRKLQQRDQEVRTHEAAHQAAGGAHASGPSFTYQKGPDGQMYAVGGSVSIDTSKESDPEATLEKARQVQAAALAPAQPSAQDMKVAASAAKLESEARTEAAEKDREEAKNGKKLGSLGNGGPNQDEAGQNNGAAANGAEQADSARDTARDYADMGRNRRIAVAAGGEDVQNSPAMLAGAPGAVFGSALIRDADPAQFSQYAQARPDSGSVSALDGVMGAGAAPTAGSEAVFRTEASASMRLAQGRDANALVQMSIPQSSRAPERAARAYARQLPPSALAPMGSGISLSV